MALPVPHPALVEAAMNLIVAGTGGRARRPFVLGVCGAQGSGKSTLAAALVPACAARGQVSAVLSLDDLYLGHAARQELAERVHPLFATRGVPGTHDIALGLDVLAALDRGERVPLPRFDKAGDDRCPESDWPLSPAHLDVLVFEGWCVGARAQDEAALVAPVNALEAAEDAEGRWRRAVNAALAGPYQALFARVDRLMLLAAPGFEVVRAWRWQQEQELARSSPGGAALMDEAALGRFVCHYERLTRHILAEMPARADLTVRLGTDRAPCDMPRRPPPAPD